MTNPMHNYLRMCRRRVGLSQEDVAKLLDFTGPKGATSMCRHEMGERLPTLEDALAYERLYGLPVKELFAGVYRRVELQLRERAEVLIEEVEREPESASKTVRLELLSDLLARDDFLIVPTWSD